MPSNFTVVLGITGSIAAYKSCEIIRTLKKKGANVYVLPTQNALKFITRQTLETLSGNPVIADMFDRETPWEVEHIALARKADAVLIAPASANTIAKYAHGECGDMLTTTLLATRAPVLIAPAMNSAMLQHEATQRNIKQLRGRGVEFIFGAPGDLACGETGSGRLADVEDIVQCVGYLAYDKDLAGKRVLVTAGPTCESMDPVRYLTNRSSGKMGYAVAAAARARGAEVTLISGPVSLRPPYGVKVVHVRTTQEMCNAALACFDDMDIAVKAAAPADYRPSVVETLKIKKSEKAGASFTIQMSETEDILTALSAQKKQQFLVGFAAETHDVDHYAQDKLLNKGLDMICANNVAETGSGFEHDTNHVVIFRPHGISEDLGLLDKTRTAHRIFDAILMAQSV